MRLITVYGSTIYNDSWFPKQINTGFTTAGEYLLKEKTKGKLRSFVPDEEVLLKG